MQVIIVRVSWLDFPIAGILYLALYLIENHVDYNACTNTFQISVLRV